MSSLNHCGNLSTVLNNANTNTFIQIKTNNDMVYVSFRIIMCILNKIVCVCYL